MDIYFAGVLVENWRRAFVLDFLCMCIEEGKVIYFKMGGGHMRLYSC